jgi:hypothetical protein
MEGGESRNRNFSSATFAREVGYMDMWPFGTDAGFPGNVSTVSELLRKSTDVLRPGGLDL